MLTIQLKSKSEENLYLQIYGFIKNEILEGRISKDEKLPSKRNLAKNLGVSVLTVETAYSQLLAEGFIYSVPQKGFFAEKIEFQQTERSKSENKASSKSDSKKIPLPEQNENPEKAGSQAVQTVVNLSGNQTDPRNFPFSIWAKIIRSILHSRQNEVLKNSPAQGTIELRAAIAEHLRDFRGMEVDPARIVIGAGTEYLYGLLIQLLGFDKTYAIEDPCHNKIEKIYDSFGVRNVQIPMDSNGILVEELKKQNADIVHISPSHHFPTGIVMPVSRRYELLNWAQESPSRFLIEDDYDSEFRFTGRPIPTMQSIDSSGKIIYMNTFTKTLSSTIRISYMILPSLLAERFSEKLNFYACTVPTIDQLTLAQFISQGYFEKHINRMRKLYGQKREMFVNCIKKYDTSQHFEILEGNSGLHFLLKVQDLALESFKNRLNKEGIVIATLSNFYKDFNSEAEKMFVVNYSGIPLENIEQTVKKLTF
ncbi:MAG: PLP-dependent aminotransferase family protein [Treponema sp.]|nr:PLP-dependent aminotransferase family protein [Candidatus Treponema equifaecale]